MTVPALSLAGTIRNEMSWLCPRTERPNCCRPENRKINPPSRVAGQVPCWVDRDMMSSEAMSSTKTTALRRRSTVRVVREPHHPRTGRGPQCELPAAAPTDEPRRCFVARPVARSHRGRARSVVVGALHACQVPHGRSALDPSAGSLPPQRAVSCPRDVHRRPDVPCPRARAARRELDWEPAPCSNWGCSSEAAGRVSDHRKGQLQPLREKPFLGR